MPQFSLQPGHLTFWRFVVFAVESPVKPQVNIRTSFKARNASAATLALIRTENHLRMAVDACSVLGELPMPYLTISRWLCAVLASCSGGRSDMPRKYQPELFHSQAVILAYLPSRIC